MAGDPISCGGSTIADRVVFVGTASPAGAYLNAGISYIDHQLSDGGTDWYDDAYNVKVGDDGVVGDGPQDLQTIGQHEFLMRQLGGAKASCTITREWPPDALSALAAAAYRADSPAASEGSETPAMASVRIKVAAYATKKPICDATNGSTTGTTTTGRVRVWGFVTMNAEAHWDRLFEYTDHQTASDGEVTWSNTYNILSPVGEKRFQIAAQQINTLGDHTFAISHVGDANHVATCTVTRVSPRA